MRAYAPTVFLILAACGGATRDTTAHNPARYLYVWAGTGNDSTNGTDMLTVLDANPRSSAYGSVLSALTVDTAGRMPHHTEFSLPAKGVFFANDFSADRSFLIDFRNRAAPRLAGKTVVVPGGRRLHSFARLPNGNVLASVQFGDAKTPGEPGGLAEFDSQGRLVRSGWSKDPAFPGARIRTYGLTVLPAINRAVTTSSPMKIEQTAHVVQVWRLSDLKLLKTLAVPSVPGDSSHMYPFEIRTLADGRSALMNTYYCAFYHITNIESTPKIERVMTMSHPQNIGCSVPVIAGQFELMPIAYAHRIAVIDISDSDHPKEVASLPTDTTFFPHWASADPGSDRIVLTEQGDGPPKVLMLHFDRTTGRLFWDESFRDPGSRTFGVSYDRASWPNGVKGMAMPHGAVFVP
ncbi:MAG TPA: hypothetical protein VIF83_11205 [Gemmatimonadaceae bacterium]|jgi:hypothetical protein